MESWLFIVAITIIVMIVAGFFIARIIRLQMEDLKVDLMKTVKEKDYLRKYTMLNGTQNLLIRGKFKSAQEKRRLLKKAEGLEGVLEVSEDQEHLVLNIDILKKLEIMDMLEAYRRMNNLKFFIIVNE